ncbi:MAG TPA: hypothetical protein VHE61_12760, partial [Opitutaceae bacterium]|nr:hypothetical protein [Opitutaceae bacterium]
ANDPSGISPVRNLVDGDPRTEYASAGKGLQTFVEFDFGAPTAIAGFRHQDRKNGTIAGSELTLFDAAGRVLRRIAITHPDQSSAVTFVPVWPAVVAQRARWQVTRLGAGNAAAVGGAEVEFFGVGPEEPAPTGTRVDAIALPIATPEAGGLDQPLRVTVDYPYPEPSDATLRVGDLSPRAVHLVAGPQTVVFSIPIADHARRFPLTVTGPAGAVLAQGNAQVPAFRKLTVYVLPHSHVDIGYTELQTAIEQKQLNNLLVGMAEARRTANYPADARFIWNLEGLWPADNLLRRLNPHERDAFFDAIRHGQVGLDGMYFNTLTGLCRPEELVRLFRFGTKLSQDIGVPLDAAMISDVPGYTWGTVAALRQAGIKYFSAAPNIFDRIGDTYVAWENKPFWWVGSSPQDRVLVWVPVGGYNLAARIGRISDPWVENFTEELTRTGYPYDIEYIRWSRGDNAPPDLAVADEVRAWNAQHPWPHFVIGTVHQAFSALEQKYGDVLPKYRGDWTPYWEDGAGSSARETAMNRDSSDRLAQAEALWAMQQPSTYPASDFANAMRQLLLYDEHTWGASGSVTNPAGKATIEQWEIKSADAATAADDSRDLLLRALALADRGETAAPAVDVFNANSWTRSGLVTLARDVAPFGDNRVTDDHGAPVPSQRLSSGDLVFYARDLPAFSARRYVVSPGPAFAGSAVTVTPTSLDNGVVRVGLDPKTGGIVELRGPGAPGNLAQPSDPLNTYLYFNGNDPRTARSNGAVTIRVEDKGPLVATLRIESSAPGCYSLVRRVTLVAGEDHAEIDDTVDKQRIVASNYRPPEAKESVNFGFPFAVPGGQVRIEVPFGVVRPDADQIPGACKNWFTVDRWADVSNGDYGVTWVTLDAPLVQVGGLTADLLNSQTNPAVWRQHVGPTQSLYAWVMNNHWGTNYRAYQEGPVTFRFLLRPHGAYDPAAASRLAIAASQPLQAVRARGPVFAAPRLTLDSPDVIVTGMKPSDDGRALIVRLWAAADHPVGVHLRFSDPQPTKVWLSDTGERRLRPAGDLVTLPSWGLVSIRADLP